MPSPAGFLLTLSFDLEVARRGEEGTKWTMAEMERARLFVMFTQPDDLACLLVLKRYEREEAHPYWTGGVAPSPVGSNIHKFTEFTLSQEGKTEENIVSLLLLKNVPMRRSRPSSRKFTRNEPSEDQCLGRTKDERRRLIATMGRAEKEERRGKLRGTARPPARWMELMR